MPFSGSASAVAAFPAVPPAVSSPTRLRLPDLLHTTDRFADEVLRGCFNRLLPPGGPPTDARWFTRLHADDELDVWLISWVPGHTTELHDHGGSLGALTVLSGALHEYRWDGERLRRRRLDAGDQAAFPLGWVHDVGRPHDDAARLGGPPRRRAIRGSSAPTLTDPATTTLSVHAYSPPLTAMSYYEVTERATLRRTRTDLTDGPEGQ
jgi:Cysteine dioxygenase type I